MHVHPEQVPTPYATTDFKYSRFDATKAAPRNIARLVGEHVLNFPFKKAGAVEGFVGSTERTHKEHVEL